MEYLTCSGRNPFVAVGTLVGVDPLVGQADVDRVVRRADPCVPADPYVCAFADMIMCVAFVQKDEDVILKSACMVFCS